MKNLIKKLIHTLGMGYYYYSSVSDFESDTWEQVIGIYLPFIAVYKNHLGWVVRSRNTYNGFKIELY